jgi:hypothetical protein
VEGVEFRLGEGGAVTWLNVPSADRSFPLFMCNAFQVLQLFCRNVKLTCYFCKFAVLRI